MSIEKQIDNRLKKLEEMYKGALKEFFRLLDKKGVVLFKCQDYTDSKTTMTHCLIWKWAIEQGFYVKDLAILINKRRIFNPNLKQRHLRKTHTYYFVLQKVNSEAVGIPPMTEVKGILPTFL